MTIVYIKTAVSLALSLALLGLLWQRTRITNRLQGISPYFLDGCWLVFRLIPFLITYVLLDYRPQSDVATFYFPIGISALDGGVPYRDVYSCYSPLFGYWLAPFLALWRDMRVVVLAMMVVEWLAVRLTHHYYQTDESPGQRLFRVLFYYLLPLPLVMCVFSGQEDVILWLFVLLALPFMQIVRSTAGKTGLRAKPYVAGLILGMGMLATKAVFVLILIWVFWLTLTNRRFAIRFVAGLLTVGVPVVLFMVWKTGFLFLEQQSHEGDFLKAPNWRSVLNPLMNNGLRSMGFLWKWGGLLITLAVMGRGVWLVRTRHPNWQYRDYMPFLYILTFSTMTVVQQNAISNYAYLFMLPLVFSLADFKRTTWCLALIGFNILAAIHPSLWWRLGQPYYTRFADFANPVALMEYSVEVGLVIGFIYYAVEAMKALRRPQPIPRANPHAV